MRGAAIVLSCCHLSAQHLVDGVGVRGGELLQQKAKDGGRESPVQLQSEVGHLTDALHQLPLQTVELGERVVDLRRVTCTRLTILLCLHTAHCARSRFASQTSPCVP